jgi:hypothetical protein
MSLMSALPPCCFIHPIGRQRFNWQESVLPFTKQLKTLFCRELLRLACGRHCHEILCNWIHGPYWQGLGFQGGILATHFEAKHPLCPRSHFHSIGGHTCNHKSGEMFPNVPPKDCCMALVISLATTLSSH